MTILIVDDQALFREGIKLLLARRPDASVVGEAALPGLLEACPGARVIFLSSFGSRDSIDGFFEAGAMGYLLKASYFEELDGAIDFVMSGRRYASPRLVDSTEPPDR
jgi:DNA-binding NarL/FixJ family response regulator